jgi:ribonuclease P protein subunit RPR2
MTRLSTSALGLVLSGDFVLDESIVSAPFSASIQLSFTVKLTMAKVRVQKEAKNAKSHLKARMDYLQQAARYLQDVHLQDRAAAGTNTINPQTTITNIENPKHQTISSASSSKNVDMAQATISQSTTTKPLTNLSRVYTSHMRGVSLKTQTRLAIPVKRSFCKRCDTSLIPGVSCTQEIRNESCGRKKPWADVLVIRCLTCSTEKRFPQAEKRSKKLSERPKESKEKEQEQAESQDRTGTS